jgi:hypothetical protein
MQQQRGYCLLLMEGSTGGGDGAAAFPPPWKPLSFLSPAVRWRCHGCRAAESHATTAYGGSDLTCGWCSFSVKDSTCFPFKKRKEKKRLDLPGVLIEIE